MIFLIGQKITLRARFLHDGAPSDPTTVALTIEAPDGSQTNLTPSQESPGIYTQDYVPPAPGEYFASISGSGANEGVCEIVFTVIPSLLA